MQEEPTDQVPAGRLQQVRDGTLSHRLPRQCRRQDGARALIQVHCIDLW